MVKKRKKLFTGLEALKVEICKGTGPGIAFLHRGRRAECRQKCFLCNRGTRVEGTFKKKEKNGKDQAWERNGRPTPPINEQVGLRDDPHLQNFKADPCLKRNRKGGVWRGGALIEEIIGELEFPQPQGQAHRRGIKRGWTNPWRGPRGEGIVKIGGGVWGERKKTGEPFLISKGTGARFWERKKPKKKARSPSHRPNYGGQKNAPGQCPNSDPPLGGKIPWPRSRSPIIERLHFPVPGQGGGVNGPKLKVI